MVHVKQFYRFQSDGGCIVKYLVNKSDFGHIAVQKNRFVNIQFLKDWNIFLQNKFA